jgi:Leucine-rich repeat (LRR) protein
MKFTSILKNIIVEESKFEVLSNALTKPTVGKDGKKQKPKLSTAEFYELLQADPTTKLNNVDLGSASPEDLKKVKAGSYVAWIIKHYLSPKTERQPGDPGYEQEVKNAKITYLEDLSKITNDLQKFIRFKGRIEGEKDLNKLTPEELYNKVKDFSLEKTKASAQEKQEASKTFAHPGGEVAFRGKDWTVVKISDKGQLGKDAACFYGGYYLEPGKGETRWCTSGPGLNWFERYISKGPLYVVIPNNATGKIGEKSGLPAERYQFHFPDNQFMDVHDHQIDLVKYLNGPMAELKDYFKPEFARGLTTQKDNKLSIESFTQGPVGKFVALYGFDDLLGSIPEDLEYLEIINKDKNNDIIITIPQEIGRFKNLNYILLDNCISSIPDSVCELKNLRFLALINNPKLTSIPECINNLKDLLFLNLRGSQNVKIPESILSRADEYGDGMYNLSDM